MQDHSKDSKVTEAAVTRPDQALPSRRQAALAALERSEG